MAIIKCNNCGNEVSDKAKKCPHCDYVINDENGIDYILNNVKLKVEETKQNTEVRKNSNKNRIYNKVANKFKLVICICKILGYLGAIVTFILYCKGEKVLMGIVAFIVWLISIWLSTLILEAIAEGLQLLEDIKNK